MKQLLIIGLALFSFQSFGQANLDSTTKWTYSFWNFGIYEPDSLFISGDTIMEDTKWFKLDGDGSCAFINPDSLPYIRELDNKWFVYDINRKTESTLYDFNLIEGESYIVNIFGPNFPIDVRIDSVRTVEISGRDYKVQYCSNPLASTEGFFFAFEVIEGIGSTKYLFPQGNICDPHTGPIRCFSNITEFVDFDSERDCDERYFPSNTNNIIEELDIQIYPNPAVIKESIICTSTKKIIGIELINRNGLIVQSFKSNTNELTINVSDSGLYFLRIKFKNGAVTKKVVVSIR